MIRVQLENVLEFLQDENLANPIKISNEHSENWKIFINDPFIDDDKMRLSIGPRKYEDDDGEITRIVFNGFKSSAVMGDDYHGDLFSFVKLVKNFNTRDRARRHFLNTYVLKGQGILKKQFKDEDVIQKKKIDVYWPDYERLDINKSRHKRYIKFLKSRGVDTNTIKKLKIFIDTFQQRLVFPVYENNELIFYTKRSIEDHKYTWLKAKGDEVYPIWNMENVCGEEIWIFEGIFDAIHIENGVAIVGVAYRESIKKMVNRNYSKYVVVMDNDKAGLRAKLIIAKILRDKYKKKVYIYNYKGIESKDFGEMKENNINFEFDKRILEFNMKTEILLKLGKIK